MPDATEHRPTDEQLREWGDPDGTGYPGYYESEHQYLEALFTELLELRAALAAIKAADPLANTHAPWEFAPVIATVEELRALWDGTVIRFHQGGVAQKSDGVWEFPNEVGQHLIDAISLPAIVIWAPESLGSRRPKSRKKPTLPEENQRGVWVVADNLGDSDFVAVFPTELDALRFVNSDENFGSFHARFLPYGTWLHDLNYPLKASEARP